jgi:hypothetical protein
MITLQAWIVPESRVLLSTRKDTLIPLFRLGEDNFYVASPNRSVLKYVMRGDSVDVEIDRSSRTLTIRTAADVWRRGAQDADSV